MNKKVLFLVNHELVIYNFRKELVKACLDKGYTVFISSPYGEKIDSLINMGCKYCEVKFNRRGVNVFDDLKLLHYYNKLIKKIKPDVVLSFTIKPNVYGGLACRNHRIIFIPNITGLGTSIEKKGITKLIIKILYKISFKKAKYVIFQNTDNFEYFNKYYLKINNGILVPGSGVNLIENKFEKIEHKDKLTFTFIGRIMKEKGISEFLSAAKYLYKECNCTFNVVGFIEEKEYEPIISEYEKNKIINYLGYVKNTHDIIRDSDCIVLPSHHEGMSNVLLEAQACGRPVIASNIPGCIETFDNNVTGFSFEVKSTFDLINKIQKFSSLDFSERKKMGFIARERVERLFDRNIIIEKYIKLIEE